MPALAPCANPPFPAANLLPLRSRPSSPEANTECRPRAQRCARFAPYSPALPPHSALVPPSKAIANHPAYLVVQIPVFPPSTWLLLIASSPMPNHSLTIHPASPPVSRSIALTPRGYVAAGRAPPALLPGLR